ncbi:hypothetical protein EV356DRAFT_321167 [Viridothelium virens]|uniref:VWFA domain-containing protein n=1 Tax=Viridothelium virens TaxID=1048519 RepID=A0A6A6GZT5_VIRVR|nr:hypothetical protein EV356DRAFT_321167 [Viridothelium virens]
MTPESSRSPTIMTLSPPTGHPSPPHVYHLPFDICSVRRRLEAEKPRSNFEKWKAKIGKEVKDPELARHVVDRDIVLVVDNGSTMAQHWPTAQFVAQTLGMQVMPLDDDGIDVRFTINGAKYNKKALRGSNGIKELEKLLSSARPSEPQPEDSREATDMNFVFSDLFRDYWTKGIQKQTMILILTDAVWEGTSLDKMNQTIVRFAQEVEKDRRRFNPRHFTLGFIHIGDGVEEKRKLKSLDDDLCRKNGLNDIIDACSWKTRVRKMILGSLLAYEDETEADGDDVATLSSPQSPTASLHYEQQVLNRLFDEFNSGRLKVILPDLRSHHMHGASSRNSLSVSPSRHTFGLSTNRDATLTGTSLKSTETKSSWKDKFSAQFKSQG